VSILLITLSSSPLFIAWFWRIKQCVHEKFKERSRLGGKTLPKALLLGVYVLDTTSIRHFQITFKM